MTTQNLWDAAKADIRGKFRAIQCYLKKQEKHRIDSLTLHLRQLEEEKHTTTTTTTTTKTSRRNEAIEI